jgi:hypothetical protein
MPRVCTICPREARSEIESAIVVGEPIRRIAAAHGVSEAALRRHRDRHLVPALGRAIEEERIDVDADRLTAWAASLQRKTLTLLAKAEAAGDLTNARGFVAEARKNLELLGRVAGVLDASPQVAIDARRQVAVLANLSEEELRALAAQAVEAVEEAEERVPSAFPVAAIPGVERDPEPAPARLVGGRG